MKEQEMAKLLSLMEKLIEASEKDVLSSQRTKDLIKKNISTRMESIRLGKIKAPSEFGERITMGLGRHIGELKVSEEVLDCAYAIDKYFRTL